VNIKVEANYGVAWDAIRIVKITFFDRGRGGEVCFLSPEGKVWHQLVTRKEGLRLLDLQSLQEGEVSE
jgi:hypothetical protein